MGGAGRGGGGAFIEACVWGDRHVDSAGPALDLHTYNE